MPKFLIERDVPGAGDLTPDQLQQMAQRSMCAMEHLREYRWLQSYVAGDKVFCVHEAANEESIREHSRRGGFPITTITKIDRVIDPRTAQPRAAMIAGG